MASNRLEVKISGDARQLQDTFASIQKSADQTSAKLSSMAQTASLGLAGLATSGGLLTKSFIDSASQMQQFQATLTAITGSSEKASAQLAKLVEFAAKTPFELPGVVEAGVKIQALGINVDKFLPLAGNMAAAMGKNLPEAAQALAKAASGSQDGIQQLTETYGISRRELLVAGATMGEAGSIAVASGKDIDKLQAALARVIGTKFGNAMDEQSKTLKGAFSNLSDAVGQVKASLGEKLAPTFESAARSLTKLVDGFKSLPESSKELIAQGVLLATAVVGISVAVVGMVAMAGPVTAAFAALTTSIGTVGGIVAATGPVIAGIAGTLGTIALETTAAASTFGVLGGAAMGMASAMSAAMGAIGTAAAGLMALMTPLLAVGAALGAVAIGLAVYTANLNAATKEQEANLKVGVKLLQNFHDQKIAIGETGEALRLRGKTDVDITKQMLGLRELQKNAEEAGNTALVAKFEAEIDRLRTVRSQFAGTEAAKQAAIQKTKDDTKAATSAAITAADEFQKKRSDGFFQTKKLEAEALHNQLAALEAQAEAIAKIDDKAALDVKTRIKALKDEQVKLDRDARKEAADNAVKDLEEQAALGKISKEQEAKALEQLANQFADVQNFKRDTLFKSAQKQKEANEDLLQSEAKTLEATRAQIETRAKGIEDQIKHGGDLKKLGAQLKADIIERGKLEEEAIKKRLAAEQSKTSDPKIKADLEKQAQIDISKSHDETAQKILQNDEMIRKSAGDRIKTEIEGEKARKAVVDANLEQLREKLKSGEDVGAQLEKQLKLQQKIEEAILKKDRAEKLAEADPRDVEKVAQIKKAADNDLKAFRIKSAREEKKTQDDIKSERAKDSVEALGLARREHDERVAQLEERKARGEDVSKSEIALAREALDLRVKEIAAKEKADEIGKAPVEQARLQRQAELDIIQARRDSKKAIDDINKAMKSGTDELTKQKDELKGINDELAKLKGERDKDKNKSGAIIGNLDDFFKSEERDKEISRLETAKRRGESNLEDLEKSKKSVAANQAEGDRTGKTIGGRTPAEIARQAEIDAIEQDRDKKRQAKADEIQAQGRAQAAKRLEDLGKTPAEIEAILGKNFGPAKADGAAPAEAGMGAAVASLSESLLQKIATTLEQIAQNPASVEIKNGRGPTEEPSWNNRTNRTPGL